MKAPSGITLALVGLALLVLFSGNIGGCPISTQFETVVAGTYFYEQRAGDPPPPVLSAIDKLNVKGIVADIADVDVLDKGGGSIPKQYELTLPEAKKVGPPAWVTRSNTRVLKSVKDPKTEEDILATAP